MIKTCRNEGKINYNTIKKPKQYNKLNKPNNRIE